MSCRRSFEIELPEFLAEPGAAAFDEFRAHYPRCPECAAEVRAWTELDAQLAAGDGSAVGAHPGPEQMARYEALAAGDRAGLDRHLAGCPSCREELRQLRAFSPERLAQQVRKPLREGRGRARRALGSLGQLVWHPAFAYAIAGLLLFPTLWQSLERTSMPSASTPAFDDAAQSYAAAEPLAQKRAKSRASASGRALALESAEMETGRFDEEETGASPPVLAAPAAKDVVVERRVVAQAAPDWKLNVEALTDSDAPAEVHAAYLKARPTRAEIAAATRYDFGAPVPPPADDLVVRLTPGAMIEVEAPRDVDFLRLLIPVPAGEGKATVAGLRIASASGRREIRERSVFPAASPARPEGAGLLAADRAAIAPEASARQLEWRVPRDWLETGVYRVELSRPGDRSDAEQVVGVFFLVVHTP
jgi:hypothetical protein